MARTLALALPLVLLACRGTGGGDDRAAPAASTIPRAAPSARGASFPRGAPSAASSASPAQPEDGSGGGTML